MGFNFAEEKAAARRAVHDTFALDCTLLIAPGRKPTALRARLHVSDPLLVGNAGASLSSLGSNAFAEIVERADAVVFDREELAAKNVRPCQGMTVTFPDYSGCFTLEVKAPDDGPIDERWTVARAR